MKKVSLVGASLRLAPTLLILLLVACGERPTVTLALLGDLNLGRSVEPGPDSLTYLDPELSAADLALANLESPFGMGDQSVAPTSEYNLCAPAERADLLPLWGLDLVSIANNHNLDCGPDGPAKTRTALERVGVAAIGPDMQPVLREVNGVHLAFLAFDDVSSPLDETAAGKAIRSAHDTGAVVVVSIHWGLEYQGGASDRQKSLAQEFAEAGAALIWGHHPHVLQPAAWVDPPEGSKPSGGSTLVLYSLGNALFDQRGMEDTRRSALVVVTLDGNGVTGVHVMPFEIDVVDSRVVQPDADTAEMMREIVNLP